MKRLLRIIFNVVASVSLVLCAATVILALRGSFRDMFIGRSSVHPGLDPQASFAAVTSTAPPVPPGISTLRFNEDVFLIAVIDGDIWLTRHVATYESWVRLDTGELSGGYAGIQQLALARQGSSWHSEGYSRQACPALGWRNDSGTLSTRPLTPGWSRLGIDWYADSGVQNVIALELGARDATFVPRTWRLHAIKLPPWFAAIAFFLLPLSRWGPLAWRALLRKRRRTSRLCSACGYDLRATPERCPECGTVTSPARSGTA